MTVRLDALAALLALSLLAACTSVHLQLGAGYEATLDYGRNPRGIARLVAERAECFGGVVRCFAEYDHHSSVGDGWPFNHHAEQLTNHYGVGIDIPLWRARP